jgi:nicotinamide mononucleotide (NMN) deamidase PncC
MNVARYVVGFLQSRGLVLASAESCTAGLIASQLAEVPASGACLDVGFVVFPIRKESGFLGVLPETIKTYGLRARKWHARWPKAHWRRKHVKQMWRSRTQVLRGRLP